MISAILAAALLQTAVPAQCSVNRLTPTPCQVVQIQEGEARTVGFALTGGDRVVFEGQRVDANRTNVFFVTVNGIVTRVQSGACLKEGRMIGCRINVENNILQVIAQLDR